MEHPDRAEQWERTRKGHCPICNQDMRPGKMEAMGAPKMITCDECGYRFNVPRGVSV